jgi:hypothetical protein
MFLGNVVSYKSYTGPRKYHVINSKSTFQIQLPLGPLLRHSIYIASSQWSKAPIWHNGQLTSSWRHRNGLQRIPTTAVRTEGIDVRSKPKRHLEEIDTGGPRENSQPVCPVLHKAMEVGEGQIVSTDGEMGDEGCRVRHKQNDGSEIGREVDDTRRRCVGRRIRACRSNDIM